MISGLMCLKLGSFDLSSSRRMPAGISRAMALLEWATTS